MLFNSFEFPVFLGAVLLVYHCLPHRASTHSSQRPRKPGPGRAGAASYPPAAEALIDYGHMSGMGAVEFTGRLFEQIRPPAPGVSGEEP